MIFDQYSRYRACADLIRQTGFISGESVLDVGSGPDCLLGNFLPEAKIVFVDPLITEPMRRGRFQGTADDERLDRLRFDCVVAVDVLEHIPPGERARFLSRLATIAEDSLVIGFPAIESGSAPETDQAINSLYRQTYDQDYPWLDEHQRFRLPSLGATVTSLTQEGWHCQTLGHGHAPWLSELLGPTICAWEIPKLKDLVLAISERFNRELYESDFRPPHYRHFIVATRQPIAPLIAPTALDYADRLFETIMNQARQQYFVESMKLLVGAEGSALRVEALVAERNDILARNEILLIEREVLVSQRDNAYNDIHARNEILLIEREVLVSQRDNAYDELSRIRQSKALRAAGFIWRQKWWMAHYLDKLRDPRTLAVSLKSRFEETFRRHQTSIRRVLARSYPEVPSPSQTIQQVHPKSDAPFLPPVVHPRPRSGSKLDYVVWGVIDWHFRHQRPQHLCRELAANQRRVLYISAVLIDDQRAGFTVEQLDDDRRLFQVRLFAEGAPSIYSVRPDRAIIEQLRSGAGELLKWADIGSAISIVHHPFWYEMAGVIPDSRLVYDCLDHHGGFDNTSPDILEMEQQLLRKADLTVTTSSYLDQLVAGVTPQRKLIRNAAEFERFSTPPPRVFRDDQGRRVIGYIGAIAGWFDLELMATVAESFPDCLILLIGDDTVKAAAHLGSLPNVRFVGEVPYHELPYYLHGFDVCLLPFRITPLTLATNPVKIYEYLSAGKPVVAVDLPEMASLAGLVAVAPDADSFIRAIADILARDSNQGAILDRMLFARGQTWKERARELISYVEDDTGAPLVSVIVVAHNKLELTRACLESLAGESPGIRIEVIVVDNGSTDGTARYLSEWRSEAPQRHVISNDDNRGFAAANNQGLALATGDYLVILNNDTYVTPGWARTLVSHLRRDNGIGLIGPVTNNIGNEARIEISYSSMAEMVESSVRYTRSHPGRLREVPTLAFFCVMMPRQVYEQTGNLDESFGRGFFEDDDYCRRVEELGLKIVCADDVFVHHQLSATFNELPASERQALFARNRRHYESKWGPWIAHQYRKDTNPAS